MTATTLNVDLLCNRAEVTIAGAGRATLWATDSLNAQIAGSGKVDYFGNPETHFITAGTGTFNNLGTK